MNNRLLVFIVISVLFALLVSCAQTPAEGEVMQIKAVVLPYTSFGPLFIAQEEDIFGEYNLEVEFVRMESGTSPLALLEQGEVDVLGSGPNLALFNALAGGSDIRVVSDKGYLDSDGCTYMALLAPPEWADENQAPTADSLRDKQVSIDPLNFEAFMFDQVLQDVGLSLNDVNMDDIPPPALIEALQNDAVNIVSVGDPWITRLVDTGEAVIWKPYQEVVPNMQFGFILFGRNLRLDNPDAGARFMAALLDGVEQYNEGKTPRNLEILSEYTQLDTATLEKACWPPMNLSGEINLDTVNQFQNWAVEQDLQDSVIPDEEYWDQSILDQANKLRD
jgi:ABC-type nitrate/sulfonate/bicarbonate transport system substrate-binding protein